MLKKLKSTPFMFHILLINFITSLIFFILFGIITFFIFYMFSKSSYENELNTIKNVTQKTSSDFIDQINSTSLSIFYNQIFFDILNEENDQAWHKTEQINDYLTSYSSTTSGLIGLGFFSNSGTLYESSGYLNLISYDYIASMVNSPKLASGRLFYLPPELSEGSYVGVAMRQIRNTDLSPKTKNLGIGIILFDMDTIFTRSLFHSSNDSISFYVYDGNNQFIASRVGMYKEETQTPSFEYLNRENRHSQTAVVTIPQLDWKIVIVQYNYKNTEIIYNFLKIMAAVLCINICILCSLIFYISNHLLKPIKELMNSMNEFAAGKFKTKIYFPYKNEFTILADVFNNMTSQLYNLTHQIVDTQRQLYETELSKTRLELLGLQTQINSHFLFNTLFYIRSKLSLKDLTAAKQSINLLCKYLQYVINISQFVSLEDELDCLTNYMLIFQKRTTNKMSFKIDAAPSLYSLKLLRMLLQPIVENSIMHGYNSNSVCTTYTIKVKCVIKNEYLYISIYDTGCGFDNADEFNKKLKEEYIYSELPKSNSREHGIGLKNIYRRMRLYYNEDCDIYVKSFPSIGTIITLKLPVSHFENGDETDV